MGGVIGEKVGMGRDGPELDPPESTNPATGLAVGMKYTQLVDAVGMNITRHNSLRGNPKSRTLE